MLDQLVAFCGETIAESDVLNVFGFTSEQTVAGFTEKILRGETSEALAVLDEQAAAGKEMMKLMSDLIAHLRDLLVFKVRPDALSEEAAPELQSSLGEEAVLIETDRLLELIEQFADAEGRMKWAPNKKLHFEVAVIKAIQTLSQVTLDEVIDNLAALRGGGAAPSKSAAPVVRPTVAKPAPAKKTASAEKAAPRVAETATAPSNPEAADFSTIWPQAVQLASARRPLIRSWIEAAQLLGTEGQQVLLGFATEQKTSLDMLARPATRSFIEALLAELSGSKWGVKMSLVEGLAPVEKSPRAAEPDKAEPNGSVDSFKDDPLIQGSARNFQRRNQIRKQLTR